MTLKYSPPAGLQSVLTTELNSLASATLSSLSAEQSNDQTGEYDPLVDVEVYIAAQGTNRAVGSVISVYVFPKFDGNYPDTTNECLDNYHAGACSVDDGALTARRLIIQRVELPSSDFKIAITQTTGTALASSGNTVKIIRYSVRDV